MKDVLLNIYAFNLGYAHRLLKDIPAGQLCEQVAGIPNHPLWVIGHLAMAGNFAASFLDAQGVAPAEWAPLFGNSSKPEAKPELYPDLATVLSALEQNHAAVAATLKAFPDARLSEPNTYERAAKAFPTRGDMVGFLLTGHETQHLGQLSSWRRAAGLGPA